MSKLNTILGKVPTIHMMELHKLIPKFVQKTKCNNNQKNTEKEKTTSDN